MGISKLVVSDAHEYYKNKKAIEYLINYVLGEMPDKIIHYCGGFGVDYKNQKRAVKQMKKIKKLIGKTNDRLMYHYILSFPIEVTDAKLVYKIGRDIAYNFFKGYQVLFAVHEEPNYQKNLHIHFAFNSVSAENGVKWNLQNDDFKHFKQEIEQYADSYLPPNLIKKIKAQKHKLVSMEELLSGN